MTAKVLCTFGATYMGGISRIMLDGLPRLNRQAGIEVTLGDLYDREDVAEVFGGAGIPMAAVGVRRPPYTSMRQGFRRLVGRACALPSHCLIAHRLERAARGFNVVYVHTYKELALAVCSGMPLRSGARIVWHCHGLGVVPPFVAQFAKRCARVIAISGTVAAQLRESGVPDDRIVTVLNAIDQDRVRAAAEAPPIQPLPASGSAPVVLVPTASIRHIKGIHVLLKAAEEAPGLEIWIAGNIEDPVAHGYSEYLLSLASSPKLRGRVHFIGFRPDIYSVMKAATFVCIPSLCREGFGLVAAEAMALGKPVIVSNRGALPDVVGDGKAGIIFDPDRPEDLTAILKGSITGSTGAAVTAEYATTYARVRFSYERWGLEVAEVFRDVSR